MANDIIVCLNSISPQISKHSSYMRIKKETIHKRHTIFRAKAEHEAYNNHQIKSRARGIQYSDFQSTQAKGCALHTILKAEQSAWEERGGRERTRRTGDGGRRAGADSDNYRSGRSTEKGEQGLMCRSCRCGRAGAGADGWEMRTGGTRSSNRGAGERQAGMEGRPELEAGTEERQAGIECRRHRQEFPPPPSIFLSLSLSLRESARTRAGDLPRGAVDSRRFRSGANAGSISRLAP